MSTDYDHGILKLNNKMNTIFDCSKLTIGSYSSNGKRSHQITVNRTARERPLYLAKNQHYVFSRLQKTK
jgi:hypothetical protein